MQAATSLLLIAVGLAILGLPLLRYVKVGWEAKRNDILDSLSPDARLAYYKMFCRGTPTPATPNEAYQSFEALYTRWYGRRFFVAPSVLLLLVGGATITSIVLTGLHRLGYLSANPLFDLPTTAMAALAGAYLWVVNDFIGRTRSLDFSPGDVMWGVLRLAIAIPMGYAFATIAAPSIAPFIAFALGAFPLSNLLSIIRRVAGKKLGLEDTGNESADDVIKLQGINRAIVERLSNEDVTTVTQIAYCDPVRLAMRSSLGFDFVTDCVGQALAWMYFEDAMNDLRPRGLRGAVEIKDLVQDLNNADAAGHNEALAALPALAVAAKQDVATLRITLDQIAGDPFTDFLCLVWQEKSFADCGDKISDGSVFCGDGTAAGDANRVHEKTLS